MMPNRTNRWTYARAGLAMLLSVTLVAAPAKGSIYANLGRLSQQKAWPALEIAARDASDSHPTEMGFMRYHLWALREQRKHEEAAGAARKYLQRLPNEATLRTQLAGALAMAGGAALKKAPAHAAALLSEALQIDPARPHIHKLYGRALLGSGQVTLAMDHLERARLRFPGDEGIRFRLSQSYQAEWRRIRTSPQAAVGTAMLALAQRVSAQVNSALPLKESRFFVRITAGILLELSDGARLDAFFSRLTKEHPQESYTHHLIAGFWRRLYDRDPVRFRRYYDRAVAERYTAIRLYEEQQPARPAAHGLLLPLGGTVTVINAIETTYTHYGYNKYCYDFLVTDAAGSLLRAGTRGESVADYFGFGAQIRTVAPGKVMSVDDGFADLPIGKQVPSDNNEVRIQHANGRVSVYLHNKYHSARVREGQSVESGAPLAETGNSGWTLSPHTHFCLYDANGVSLPVRFQGVQVRRPGSSAWERHPGPYKQGWLLRAD